MDWSNLMKMYMAANARPNRGEGTSLNFWVEYDAGAPKGLMVLRPLDICTSADTIKNSILPSPPGLANSRIAFNLGSMCVGAQAICVGYIYRDTSIYILGIHVG